MHTARWWQLFPECWITYGQENFLHVWFGQLVPVTPFKTVNGIWKPRNQACKDKLTTLIWVLLQCLKPQHEQTGALTSQLKTEKDREKQNEGYLPEEISTKIFWESKNIWEHSGNFGLFPETQTQILEMSTNGYLKAYLKCIPMMQQLSHYTT